MPSTPASEYGASNCRSEKGLEARSHDRNEEKGRLCSLWVIAVVLASERVESEI